MDFRVPQQSVHLGSSGSKIRRIIMSGLCEMLDVVTVSRCQDCGFKKHQVSSRVEFLQENQMT